MTSGPPHPPQGDEPLDPTTRRVAASAAAASAIAWWPAFTLGTYGVIFFEQQLALWAVTAAVFVVAAATQGRRAWRSPRILALLLPSLWLLVAWLVPAGSTGPAATALFWFGIAVTLVGFPIMAAVMIRLVIPGARMMRGRQAVIALAAVVVVMGIAYAAGTQQERLFTCEDFTISGNFAPDGCTPGVATTDR